MTFTVFNGWIFYNTGLNQLLSAIWNFLEIYCTWRSAIWDEGVIQLETIIFHFHYFVCDTISFLQKCFSNVFFDFLPCKPGRFQMPKFQHLSNTQSRLMVPCFPLSQKIAVGSCPCLVSVLSQSCLCLVLSSRPAAIFLDQGKAGNHSPALSLRIKAFEICKVHKVKSQKIYLKSISTKMLQCHGQNECPEYFGL